MSIEVFALLCSLFAMALQCLDKMACVCSMGQNLYSIVYEQKETPEKGYMCMGESVTVK